MANGIDLETFSEDDELCLIDYGIASLHDLPLHASLRAINLHCNQVMVIDNLNRLRRLVSLDLSSNRIERMSGLDGLVSLRTLNLACNAIRTVEGLASLRSLTSLNLSYNRITRLTGFKDLAGALFRLSSVRLQGNQVSSLADIQECMCDVIALRHLVFAEEGTDNPVCHCVGYREGLLRSLPQLTVLDGLDRSGRPASLESAWSAIPDLDQYLEYMLSNDNSTEMTSIAALQTPKIDALLERFKKRDDAGVLPTPHQSCSTATMTSASSPRATMVTSMTSGGREEGIKTNRKKALSNPPLKQQQRTVSNGGKKHSKGSRRQPKRDIDETDESENETEKRVSNRAYPSSSVSPAALKAGRKAGNKPSNDSRSEGDTTAGIGSDNRISPTRNDPREISRGPNPKTQQLAKEVRQRDDARNTYLELMRELESERERRQKAEVAAKKLAEHIRQLHNKAKDEEERVGVATQSSSRLEEALANEREEKRKLREELNDLKESLSTIESKHREAQLLEEECRRELRTMEEELAKKEREFRQQSSQEAKRYQEAQMRASATAREADILKSGVRTLKEQLRQVQELLVSREQDHRKELEKCYPVDSPALKEMIEREVAKNEKAYEQQLKGQHEKIDLLSKQYSELEDEFRMALQIEANRFKELQSAFERVSNEASVNKQALLSAATKDEKANNLVTELTALVKEQKGRLTELTKSKQEQMIEFKERIQTLEAHVEEARRRMLQMEMLKHEKVKLEAQVQGQQSVIEGLRTERRLWGEELAQQGSSLSQDRGRLEAKIEMLTSESNNLRKQLERETDALKIKTKMIEDQTDTIRKLKEGVVERDEEIKKSRGEALRLERDLGEQLTNETAANAELQEKIERVQERKEELKEKVSALEGELQEYRDAQSDMDSKWKEKSEMIGMLEKQVRQMKETWDGREKKLADERDKAFETARMAVEKVKSMDDAFRRQLDAKERSHTESLEKLEGEKNREILVAERRVTAVEEEMRQLLRETENAKRAVEEKMKRLNRVVSELQQDAL